MIFEKKRIKRMSGAADLTWMSLESGWEVRTAVQVRSERWTAARASAAALVEEDVDEGVGTLAPLFAAAAAFFCAAFFLLASDTMAVAGDG
jgi:hypothetical protein